MTCREMSDDARRDSAELMMRDDDGDAMIDAAAIRCEFDEKSAPPREHASAMINRAR